MRRAWVLIHRYIGLAIAGFLILAGTTGALISWDTDGDGSADGSVLLQGVYKVDLRQSDFMFNEEPAFIAGISTVGSGYIF